MWISNSSGYLKKKLKSYIQYKEFVGKEKMFLFYNKKKKEYFRRMM